MPKNPSYNRYQHASAVETRAVSIRGRWFFVLRDLRAALPANAIYIKISNRTAKHEVKRVKIDKRTEKVLAASALLSVLRQKPMNWKTREILCDLIGEFEGGIDREYLEKHGLNPPRIT